MSTATKKSLVFSPARFRAEFERSGLNQMALARALGVRDNHAILRGYTNILRRYADGGRRPTPAKVEQLAEALGCEVKDLCVEVEL
ncbi:helix-turn-helix transcriptional regulator [Sphaerisporangium sp. NPDC049002]|uniref:helix-turn-helix domain-containing protein n=1 Tax=Sphaerisporangium sp. NPDC049002 TaxID=3155392 RepID=UPI0033D1AC5E